MAQRSQQSQQSTYEQLSHLSPSTLAIGAAAAAGAFMAGKWLYNNSDKVTLFLSDTIDHMSDGWGGDESGHVGGSGGMGSGSGTTATKQHPPTVGSVGGKQSSSKRNIPVH